LLLLGEDVAAADAVAAVKGGSPEELEEQLDLSSILAISMSEGKALLSASLLLLLQVVALLLLLLPVLLLEKRNTSDFPVNRCSAK